MAVNFEIYGGLVQLSGNRIEIEVTIDAVAGESPRALLRATVVETEETDLDPVEDAKEWKIQSDNSGKSIFDFSEYLDIPTTYDFTFPYGNSIAVKHPLRALDVKILAGESHIDNNQQSANYGEKIVSWQNEANAVAVRILKGGMSFDRQAQMHEAGQTFYSLYILGNRFLTHRPDNQIISYNQPVRLWYLLPETVANTRKLKVEYITEAGVTQSVSFDITIDPDGLYEFILDPAKLGIPATAKQYSVYQESTTGIQIGERRTFIIDQTYYENNTFLFSSNSLSGIDDHWFTGAVKLGTSIDSETGLQTLDRNATTRDRSVLVTKLTGSRKWTLYPGNRLTIEDITKLQDFLLARFKWIVWEGKIIPVNIEPGDFNLTDTTNDLLINDELEIVLTEAHQNSYL